MKRLKSIGLILIVGLAGIQFFPAKSNQETTDTPNDFILKYKAFENIGKS